MSGAITDLVYDYERQKELASEFPSAKFEDATDDIKGERFLISIPEEDGDRYIKWMIRSGSASQSFWVQLACLANDDNTARLRRILDELKGERIKGGAA